MIKNLRDILPGAVLETRDHGFYVVIADGMGRTALFNERGTWGRIDTTDNLKFDDGKKEVIRVYSFAQTMTLLDQISEGIKFVYETRKNTKALIKIFEVETQKETDCKRALAGLLSEKAEIDKEINAVCSELRNII